MSTVGVTVGARRGRAVFGGDVGAAGPHDSGGVPAAATGAVTEGVCTAPPPGVGVGLDVPATAGGVCTLDTTADVAGAAIGTADGTPDGGVKATLLTANAAAPTITTTVNH